MVFFRLLFIVSSIDGSIVFSIMAKFVLFVLTVTMVTLQLDEILYFDNLKKLY